MAVDALELRPRTSVALFDAALRLCFSTTGVWAITLPTGAVLVAALFNLVEAIVRQHDLFLPVVLWTGAWCLRAVTQGAACHYIEQQVLGTTPPSVRASLLAAVKRAPSLVIGSAWLFSLNAILWVFTFGIGFFFIGAHAASYAAIMRGQGSVLGLYGTTSKLLGPTKHIAPWVRMCGLSQLLLGLNLHITTWAFFAALHGMLGFDVTFADRFASLDNPTWIAMVVVVTFALFEPVRAAVATLMLIDGRVRQEGLDLIAQVEQLPVRKRAKSTPLGGGAAAAGAALAVLLFATPAFADSALAKRARQVSNECGMRVNLSPLDKQISDEDQSSLARLLNRVERRVFEDDDCDAAEAELRQGLRLYSELQKSEEDVDAKARVKDILSRPEFENVIEKEGDEATPDEPKAPDEPGWLAKLFKRFLEWLDELAKKKQTDDDGGGQVDVPTGSRDMAGANVVMIAALVVVAAVLIYILARSISRKKPDETALDESGGISQQPLEKDAMSALSKPPETWAGLADELAAKGDFREAIRHLYLALLSRLHRDGVIDYDPTLSNWEYLFAFKGAGALKLGFRELTRRFDFAWYGNEGVDSSAWSIFRRTAEPMLAPPAEGAPARA
ncbi:MAG: DUF4129 domain-containing protein [Archangium sp.]